MKTILTVLMFLISSQAWAVNRYQIRDKASGKITHAYEANAPTKHQPEWGLLERQVPKLDAQGKPVLDAQGKPVMETIPQTYEVVVTNIDAEVAARQAKVSERQARAARIQALSLDALDSSSTVAQVKAAVRALLKELVDEAKDR